MVEENNARTNGWFGLIVSDWLRVCVKARGARWGLAFVALQINPSSQRSVSFASSPARDARIINPGSSASTAAMLSLLVCEWANVAAAAAAVIAASVVPSSCFGILD